MKLHYKELGEGTPLIILHGLFGSLDNWLSLGKRFAEGHKVFLIDQRNHGRSFHHERFDYESMVEDLHFLMQDLGIEKPIILGHSMGGKVAMQFAVEYPQKIQKLIVGDIAPRFYPVHHHKIIETLLSIQVENLDSRQQVEEYLIPHIPENDTRQFLMKSLYRNEDKKFAWRINIPVIANNLEKIGGGVKYRQPVEVPSLFIRGTKSDYIQESDLPSIKAIFPNSEVIEMPNVGHWIHAEQPDMFFDITHTFLRK